MQAAIKGGNPHSAGRCLRHYPAEAHREMASIMKKLLITVSLATIGTIVFVSPVQAQRHGAFAAPPSSRTGRAIAPGGGLRTGFVHPHRVKRSFANSGFGLYFYPEDESEPGIVDLPPQIVSPPTALRRQFRARSRRSCLNCRTIIGRELQTTVSGRLVDNPVRQSRLQYPIYRLLPRAEFRRPRPAARFQPPCSFFATGTRKK